MAAIRDKNSHLSVFHRRIAARCGGKRALVAVMHKLASSIWHVPYRDIGADYFSRRDPERAMRGLTHQANALGFTVHFDPIEAATSRTG
ncbi:hypothetical protein AB0K74_30800 [Streptomyces sp. NPDC056159]|uniref:hypothetical protein n=1 Tax=Streptomyces sp. NPDC056159 TaxID=3155537 RepID=UPI0034393ED7